ncbi:hypothetical protein H4R33_005823 [Dimargaris cristalligena]|nr:hypothetical protein H4R33_005823 [Dimargaris cristalligena]
MESNPESPNTHPSASTSAETSEPFDSPLGQVAQLMQTNLSGVQSTLGSLMQTLSLSMQRTLDMTQAMNDLMESYLQQNVRISAQVSAALPHQTAADREDMLDRRPRVDVTVRNTSKVPIPEAYIQLRLVLAETAPGLDGTPTTGSLVPDANLPDPTLTKPAESTESGPVDDMPKYTRHESFTLQLPHFRPYGAHLSLHFTSPGTKRPLRSDFDFGIYTLFQCQATIFRDEQADTINNDEVDSVPDGLGPFEVKMVEFTCHANTLRNVFNIPAVNGISPLATYRLRHTLLHMNLRVVELVDPSHIVVEGSVVAAEGETLEKTMQRATTIQNELVRLNRLYET